MKVPVQFTALICLASTLVLAQSAPTITAPRNGAVLAHARPTFVGTADPGNTVTVREDAQPVCVASVGLDGNWACIPSAPLADGTHQVTAVASDGNTTSSPSGDIEIVVDTTPPAQLNVARPTMNEQVGPSSNVTGVTESGATVAVLVDGIQRCQSSAAPDGTFVCSLVDVALGVRQLTVTAADAVNNVKTVRVTVTVIEAERLLPYYAGGGGCDTSATTFQPSIVATAVFGLSALRARRKPTAPIRKRRRPCPLA